MKMKCGINICIGWEPGENKFKNDNNRKLFAMLLNMNIRDVIVISLNCDDYQSFDLK